MLWGDFQQTFLKSVLAGFLMGCGLGFLVAVATDRIPFLQRGLLPLGNLVSAVPIVGIAPIMVMWFGFDWESKAAVIVVMTFFPMLINTIAGLAASDHMQRDLMRSYGASYWQTFFKLRLPAALPFIFNALKINSTLALIGAIVAELFGSPISGMGFRISTEVDKMNVDIVWATIAVAALAGSLFYGLLALLERRPDLLASVLSCKNARTVEIMQADRETSDEKNDWTQWPSAAAVAGCSAPRRAGGGCPDPAAQMGDAGAVRRLLRGQGQRASMTRPGSTSTIKAGRPGHQSEPGDRRRRRRRGAGLDALGAGHPREGRAAGQYRPAVPEVGHDADLPQGDRHHQAGRLQGQDARRLVRRQ